MLNNTSLDYKEKTPLVSVVIPFYNEEIFLKDAIESVLQQHYSNWELILVDDGSIDKSSQIAIDYSNKHPGKIRVIDHEGHSNRGLSASRNHGIKTSNGKFIAFLDADDIWLPEKLTKQVSIFNELPKISMIIESSLYWYSWENPEADDVAIPVGAPGDRIYYPSELMFKLYPLGSGAAPCPSGWMIEKKALSRTGYFEESFKNDLQLYEDQAFLSKMYLSENVYVSSACNNWYRQRPNSIVRQVKGTGKYHFVRKTFLEWLSLRIRNKEKQNREIIKLVDKNLFPYHHPVLNLFTDLISRALNPLKKFWKSEV